MLVFSKIELIRQKLEEIGKDRSVGFVPTMGALHEGHLSLVRSAKLENDLVVVSIFVNPTQFDREEDLHNYPKTLDRDLAMIESVGCDLVFCPTPEEVYSKGIRSESFDFDGLENEMEGKFRTGHFDGVGTIVKRLFEIIEPKKAYFGEKDFQQLQIIRKMVNSEQLPVEIIACPIYREKDGLAMSSRNERLSEANRKAAPTIYTILKEVKKRIENGADIPATIKWVEAVFNKNELLDLEYIEIADEETLKPVRVLNDSESIRAFIAVFAGNVRLIDTISIDL